jgi:hypothetical protein
MTSKKALVFISHITEEKEIAILFKELIESSFLGMIEVFVSSDGESISMGQRWLDEITVALKECTIEIIICSPDSVNRPWINFEAGAGWIRNIPVIPLCHSGAEPNKLPAPLNLLQAAKATEISGLKLILPVLAQALNSKIPSVDFSDFVEKVRQFEEKYTFWNTCSEALSLIDSNMLSILKSGSSVKVEITETQINTLSSPLKFLEHHQILKMVSYGSVNVGGGATRHGYEIKPMVHLKEITENPNLVIRLAR